ncbi:XRE family transcriptional regulator [bacterium]|nr:XRE family transcriptional regulator [bacterium]
MLDTVIIHSDEYYYKIIRKNIRKYRLRNNLSQQQLADMCGITRQYLCDIENENRNKHVTIAILGRIADSLNINIQLFFEQ